MWVDTIFGFGVAIFGLKTFLGSVSEELFIEGILEVQYFSRLPVVYALLW